MVLGTKNIMVVRDKGAPLAFPDFNIAKGEHVLLLGDSGTGKTTLLSVIAGLLKPSAGTVLWQGQDFYALPDSRRDVVRGAEFGFVFQTLHLLPSLSVLQNVTLAADMPGLSQNKDKAAVLLSRLGLGDKMHRKPDALSQGEQQRAAVARAVLNSPMIILADEPTSALDDNNAQSVISLMIEQAKESGAALLVATHDSRIKPLFERTISLNMNTQVAA